MQPVEHGLFERGGAGVGKPRQKAGIEAECDGGDAGQNGGAETPGGSVR